MAMLASLVVWGRMSGGNEEIQQEHNERMQIRRIGGGTAVGPIQTSTRPASRSPGTFLAMEVPHDSLT